MNAGVSAGGCGSSGIGSGGRPGIWARAGPGAANDAVRSTVPPAVPNRALSCSLTPPRRPGCRSVEEWADGRWKRPATARADPRPQSADQPSRPLRSWSPTTAQLLFYNEAAGALLGVSFEEAGRMTAEQWTARVRPLRDATASRCSIEELALTKRAARRPPGARRASRSARRRARSTTIEASALPIVRHPGRRQRPERSSSSGPTATAEAGWRLRSVKIKVWGARGSVPAPGPRDEPLRRQHLVRRR